VTGPSPRPDFLQGREVEKGRSWCRGVARAPTGRRDSVFGGPMWIVELHEQDNGWLTITGIALDFATDGDPSVAASTVRASASGTRCVASRRAPRSSSRHWETSTRGRSAPAPWCRGRKNERAKKQLGLARRSSRLGCRRAGADRSFQRGTLAAEAGAVGRGRAGASASIAQSSGGPRPTAPASGQRSPLLLTAPTQARDTTS
jgi:hypothetical protein